MTNVAFLKVTAFNFIQIYYDNYHEKMNENPVMPTIRDVAELAYVSVATVSRVINHSPSVSEKTRYSVQRRDGSLKLSTQCKRTSSSSTKY